MKKNTQSNIRRQAGFTLFVALIVSSMLLAIGFSLSNIILKQLIFSSSGRESQLAFYAADSGAECAMYWDRKNGIGENVLESAFATSTDPTGIEYIPGSGIMGIYCGSEQMDVTGFLKDFSDARASTTFYVSYADIDPDKAAINRACAKVTVEKWLEDAIDSDGMAISIERTKIDSRGYNAPYAAGVCDVSNPRTVERAVQLTF